MKWDAFIEQHEEDLKEDPDNVELLAEVIRFYFFINYWSRAIKLARRIIDLNPDSDQGYFFHAYAEYARHNDEKAYELVDMAIETDPSNLDSYLLELKILIRNGVFERAHDLLRFLHGSGVGQDLMVRWCENWLFYCEKREVGDPDMQVILDRYRELDQEFQKVNVPERAEFYYQYALCAHFHDLTLEYGDIEELIDRGLAVNPHHSGCIDFKAWILKQMGHYDRVIAIYKELREFPEHELSVEKSLLEVYDRDMSAYLPEVAECCQTILDQAGDIDDYYYFMGRYYYHRGEYNAAEQSFLKLKELAPEHLTSYGPLAFTYMAMKRYEEALQLVDDLILLSEGRQERRQFYYHKIQIYKRMGRPYDAVAVAGEMNRSCTGADYERNCFEIFARFGLWEECEKVLRYWQPDPDNREDAASKYLSMILLALYKEDYRTAQDLYETYMDQIDEVDLYLVKCILASYEGDYDRLLEICKEQSKRFEEITGTSSGAMDHSMALIYHVMNQQEKVEEHARRGLQYMEEHHLEYGLEKPAYYSLRSMFLYLLGHEKASEREGQVASGLPLCENCTCSSCKDMDVYGAEKAFVSGDYDKARRLVETGRMVWPDELDLLLLKNFMQNQYNYLS